MIQKLFISILVIIFSMSTLLFAEDRFIVIDNDETEFSVNLDTLDSCCPHTIEKYVRNSLYDGDQSGYLLIKQKFEIGRGCFEGYNPQNIYVSAYSLINLINKKNEAKWQFNSTGINGAFGKQSFFGLYVIEEKSCCGGGDVIKYYSLNTGNLIAYSSKELLSIDLPSISEKRYVGVEDNIVPSKSIKENHVAVIFYSNTNHIIQQYLIKHPNDTEEWILDRFELNENKIIDDSNKLTPKSRTAEFNLIISFWCRCEAPVVEFSIPILDDKLDINSAIINGDTRAKIVNTNHKNTLN